jgi:hypothetical protein
MKNGKLIDFTVSRAVFRIITLFSSDITFSKYLSLVFDKTKKLVQTGFSVFHEN